MLRKQRTIYINDFVVSCPTNLCTDHWLFVMSISYISTTREQRNIVQICAINFATIFGDFFTYAESICAKGTMVVVINSDLTKVLLKKLYIKDSAIENCERES